MVPVSVEYRALHRAIGDLRSAVTSLRGSYGNDPAVLRLENDLDRLILDVADADALPAPPPPPPAATDPASGAAIAPDAHYDLPPWGEDMDDEGVGGFHGHRGTR